MAPISKRRCVMKGSCPVPVQNVSSVSDVVRAQQSSMAESTKAKSARLTGSAPSADFERSLDMFLKEARLSQESRIVSGSGGTPYKNTGEKQPNVSTSQLTVCHLPTSQQEAYRHLRQQLAELDEQQRQHLKHQILSQASVRKSNSQCSPSRAVPENSSDKSFKIAISNTVPEKKQPQTTAVAQKMQAFSSKSFESVVTPTNSTAKIPVKSNVLPQQSLRALQNISKVIHNEQGNCASTQTTGRDKGIKTIMHNLDAGKELQKISQSSLKTNDCVIFPECKNSCNSPTNNSEGTGKIYEMNEVHSEKNENDIQEQYAKLSEVELQLITKRYALVDGLIDISLQLRQMEVEYEVKNERMKEVERLEMELKRAKERLSEQRNLLSNMKKITSKSYYRVTKGRQDCQKLSKECLALGIAVKGNKYKLPAGGIRLMHLKLQQIHKHAQECSKLKKRVQNGLQDNVEENTSAVMEMNKKQ